MRALRTLAPFVVVGVILWIGFLGVVDWLDRDFLATDMAAAGCLAVAVVGLSVLVGAAQQFSLGHGTFLGLGAYTTAVVWTQWQVPPLVAVGLSVVVTALVAWPIGRILNRLSELYFAIATLALTIIAVSVILLLAEYTGGEDGLSTAFFQLGGHVLVEPRERFWLTWGTALLCAILMTSYLRSRRGRALRAVGGDEHAARALGIDATQLRTQAFVISAALAGLGGALLTFTTGFIHPGTFGITASIQLVVMVILGSALVLRSLLVTFLIALLPAVFDPLQEHLELIYGAVLVLVLLHLTRARSSAPSARERLSQWWRTTVRGQYRGVGA